MKQIGIFLFFFGIIFIIIGYFQQKVEQCNPIPQVQYRYIPRTFKEEQTSPASPFDIFDYMFYDQQPWMYGMNKDFKPPILRNSLNEYYISQI